MNRSLDKLQEFFPGRDVGEKQFAARLVIIVVNVDKLVYSENISVWDVNKKKNRKAYHLLIMWETLRGLVMSKNKSVDKPVDCVDTTYVWGVQGTLIYCLI